MLLQPVTVARQYYADWLKVICIALLLPYHAAMVFGPYPYHVKNAVTYTGFNLFNELIGMWYFSLLFFLAGFGAAISLQRRSGRVFMQERVKRLLLPLVFGMLVIVPPQTYFERLQHQQITGGYLDFYSHLFNGIYPQGNLTWNHLWYIAYLFVISLIWLPFLLFLKTRAGQWPARAVNTFSILLFAVPVMLTEYALRIYFPFGNQNLVSDWANILHFSLFYIYGYYMTLNQQLFGTLLRTRGPALVIGITGVILYYSAYLSGYFIPAQQSETVQRLLHAWRGLNAWCWSIAIIGYAHQYLNGDSPVLAYATKAFLPVYILHQTVLIIVAWYLVPLHLPVFLKFAVLALLTYFFTLLLYEFVVRRSGFLRTFFGI